MRSLGIVVFGCLTKPKYRQQLEDIWNTWGSQAIQKDCLLRFYVGDIPDDIPADMKAICVNVQEGDDYISATFKQWRGLQSMIDKEDICKFYYICGSDTFLHVHNALSVLAILEHERKLYIGGGMGKEQIEDTEYLYFSGGAGYFLTYSACSSLLENIQEFMYWWMEKTNTTVETVVDGVKTTKCLMGASDLQVGVLAKRVELEYIYLPASKMVGYGLWNDVGINKDRLISCHPMPHEECIAYDAYLRDTGVFVSASVSVSSDDTPLSEAQAQQMVSCSVSEPQQPMLDDQHILQPCPPGEQENSSTQA